MDAWVRDIGTTRHERAPSRPLSRAAALASVAGWLALATACGGGEAPSEAVDWVEAGELRLTCPDDRQPVRVKVPKGAVVSTYFCAPPDETRCQSLQHALHEGVVELPCTHNTGFPRVVRWLAPSR